MSALDTACKVLRTVVDVADIAESVEKFNSAQDGAAKTLHLSSGALKTVALVANIAEIRATKQGASHTELAKIKGVEKKANAVLIPVEAVRACIAYSTGEKAGHQAFAQACAPCFSYIRSELEQTTHQKNHQLSLPEEKRDPVLTGKPPKLVLKPPTDALVKKAIQNTTKELSKASKLEIATKGWSVKESAQVNILAMYQRVVNQVPPQRKPAQAGAMANLDPYAINLVDSNAIPEPLYEDVVFRRFVCPITTLPIRDPVGDPNGVHIYERSAILAWLQNNPTSPMTRAPLAANQLIPKPVLKALLDQRLAFHQERIRQAGRTGLLVPPPPNLLNAAIQENPATPAS